MKFYHLPQSSTLVKPRLATKLAPGAHAVAARILGPGMDGGSGALRYGRDEFNEALKSGFYTSNEVGSGALYGVGSFGDDIVGTGISFPNNHDAFNDWVGGVQGMHDGGGDIQGYGAAKLTALQTAYATANGAGISFMQTLCENFVTRMSALAASAAQHQHFDNFLGLGRSAQQDSLYRQDLVGLTKTAKEFVAAVNAGPPPITQVQPAPGGTYPASTLPQGSSALPSWLTAGPTWVQQQQMNATAAAQIPVQAVGPSPFATFGIPIGLVAVGGVVLLLLLRR